MVPDNLQSQHLDESILDKRSLRIYGHPLTIKQQIWIGFILPTTFSIILFVASFAIDVGVTHQLIRDGHSNLAAMSLMHVYAPAIHCLILNIKKPPKIEKFSDSILWYFIQILHFLFFPIGVMHRFATRLFWSLSSLSEQDPEREEALRYVSDAHQTELFFLMDAFFHSAPQALLQAYILLSPQIATSNETDLTQSMSIIISIASLGKAVALHQRYESQRVVGRLVPWTLKNDPLHAKALVNLIKFDPTMLMKAKKSQKAHGVQQQRESQVEAQIANFETETACTIPQQISVCQGDNDLDTTLELNTTKMEGPSTGYSLEEKAQDQDENEALLSQQKSKDLQSTSSEDASMPTETKGKLIIIPEEETVISTHAENLCETPLSLMATAQTQLGTSVLPLKLPKRKVREKGLAEDEPLGITMAFFGWWCFLFARVLAIASFTHFYPWGSLGIILAHYASMVIYLYYCRPKQCYVVPAMSLIFILCPVEITVRYKHPRAFLIIFAVATTLENLSTMLFWYVTAKWESWWYDYTCYIIVGAHAIAALHFAVYFFLFKPNTKYGD